MLHSRNCLHAKKKIIKIKISKKLFLQHQPIIITHNKYTWEGTGGDARDVVASKIDEGDVSGSDR